MSDNAWNIHLVDFGGMSITPVSRTYQAVRVRIVPSYVHSTPARIVSYGGMEVYVENPEALPDQFQKEATKPKSSTSYTASSAGIRQQTTLPYGTIEGLIATLIASGIAYLLYSLTHINVVGIVAWWVSFLITITLVITIRRRTGWW